MAVNLKSAAASCLLTAGLALSFVAIFSGFAFAQKASANAIKLDGKEPIAIDADKLEVLETESKAIFTGAVNVVQGATSLQTGNLIVYYVKNGTGSAVTGSAAIDRLEMSGKVIIKSETQTATGDEGSFDMKSDLFVLTGQPVVLSEGNNVAVGCKLTVQMGTGQANLDSCTKGGRVQIMINPQSAKGN